MRKAVVEISGGNVIIDGMPMGFDFLSQFLYEMAHPDPRKWYNFERNGDLLIIHVEMREAQRPVTDYPITTEVSNGNYVSERSTGLSSEGQEAANPRHEHRPNG